MKKFRRDMIRSISESRKATREEISQIHAIKVTLYELGIEQNKHDKLVEELMQYIRGSEGSYRLDYPGCHPILFKSAIYDYLKIHEKLIDKK